MTLFNLNVPALKVLLIDDSKTQRTYLRTLVSKLGIQTICEAEDGADAMSKLREFAADVAICDLHMAPVDGIEFTRLLRNAGDSPNPYLPLLMATGDATETQLKNAVLAGVNGFMSKPLELDALKRNLLTLFSRPMVFVRDDRTLRPVLNHCAPQVPLVEAQGGAHAAKPAAKPAAKSAA